MLQVDQWNEVELIGHSDIGDNRVGNRKIKSLGRIVARARRAALEKERKCRHEKRGEDETENELRCILNAARYPAAGHAREILRGSRASSTQKRGTPDERIAA